MIDDIDAIVDMIDSNMAKGVGHINLTSDEKQEELLKVVTAEQCGINTPCQIPNFKNIQDKES